MRRAIQRREFGYTGWHVPDCEAPMRKTSILLLAISLAYSVPRLHADIDAIHASALPQETALLAALDDAKQLEMTAS
ncbi:MAG: hypothetical protein ABSB50_10715 [Terracidiphilus sp.]